MEQNAGAERRARNTFRVQLSLTFPDPSHVRTLDFYNKSLINTREREKYFAFLILDSALKTLDSVSTLGDFNLICLFLSVLASGMRHKLAADYVKTFSNSTFHSLIV